MTISDGEAPAGASGAQRGLLLCLFAGSGCSALIYEIVWYQLLQLSIGSTAVSLGILLATFMGGLCIGSLALPRFFPRSRGARHPLRVYAAIEVGIAIFGLLELVVIPLFIGIYVAGAQHGLSGMLVRGLVCAVALLPPTICMGASLPAIVRWVEARPHGARDGASWWGLLYGANTLGAVFGCLFAGFYLLRVSNVSVATFVAAAINVAVAAISYLLASRAKTAAAIIEDAPAALRERDWSVHIAIACSGACALGAEVVWTRLMGLMLGATVYAFSIILAVFLVGLAFGTAAGSALVRRTDARAALGWCQFLVAIGIAWTAYAIADALPYWPIDPLLVTKPQFIFELDFARCIWAILPPTIAWGASFPLAFAAVAKGGDPGRTVGGIYAANTFGAIFGALAVSLVLIPWLGTQNSQRVMLVVAAAGALVLLAPPLWKSCSRNGAASLAFALVLVALLTWKLDAVPGELIAYGRRIAITAGEFKILYTGEGSQTSIAVSRWNADGALQFHVAGKVEASNTGVDMKLERMLGHIAALVSSNPHSVLIVGFGAGITAGTFTTYPTVNRILICELEPLIPPTTTRYFAKENYNVMHDKRTQIVYDDARHFVLTTPEKFDIITSDPIHPFVKGSAALYSKEYFEMVKAHLNPGGVVTQWVPLYESDAASVKSEIATFFAVFPQAMIFANTDSGMGYDVVLLGRNDARKIDVAAAQAKLDQPAYAPAKLSLSNVNISSAQVLFSTYIADKADLTAWLKDAQINHDEDLRLQYLAGLALNQDQADPIYRAIVSHRNLAATPFTGTPEQLGPLYNAMEAATAPPSND